MQAELDRVGIAAIRHEGIKTKGIEWNRDPYKRMYARTPGAIGCMLGQVEIMEAALAQGKHAFVMEDDLLFCDDFFDRFNIAAEFLDKTEWNILWLGGTVHYPQPWWHTVSHSEMPECHCTLNRDAEATDNQNMYRSYGSFSTHAYIVNYASISNFISELKLGMSTTIGIDYSAIRMAPAMNNYVFLPGMVIQKDNQSDIGNGWTRFSGFKNLGKHWFQKERL